MNDKLKTKGKGSAQMYVGKPLPNIFLTREVMKFLIHGYLQSKDSQVIQLIKSAYLYSSGGSYVNAIGVDWGDVAGRVDKAGCYYIAKLNTGRVGEYLGGFIADLVKQKALRLKDTHIIGLGLGAHIAGLAGAHLRENNVGLVARITGLDPAGLSYSAYIDGPITLAKEDAEFVDVIHTDIARSSPPLGYKPPLGHADFYPHGGSSQLGCAAGDGICSHSKAHEYFRRSVQRTSLFSAYSCGTLDEVTSCRENTVCAGCETVQSNFMGEAADYLKRGLYFSAPQIPTKQDFIKAAEYEEGTQRNK